MDTHPPSSRGHKSALLCVLLSTIWTAPGIAQTWHQLRSGWPIQGVASAYDAGRGRIVMHGARETAAWQDETWEWDGARWARRTAPTAPVGQTSFMVYDRARAVALLYDWTDFWQWDGQTWTRIPVSGPRPAYRVRPAVAYDETQGRVLLYGGIDYYTELTDFWAWDGAQWTQLSPAVRPTTGGGQMVFDRARSRVVLAGRQTWEWDGQEWTLVGVETPWRRVFESAIAYDATRQRVVWLDSQGGELWDWDGTEWQQRSAGVGPQPRTNASMHFDERRGRLVVFGGRTTSLTDEHWEWDGATWQQVPRSAPRLDRLSLAAAYDVGQDRTVVRVDDETWEWDGARWALRSSSGGPTGTDPALAYDPIRRHVVAFGGRGLATAIPHSETWRWDGGAWSRIDAGLPPPARYNAGMAWDPVRQRIVLHGGWNAQPVRLQDTWEWDGSSWRQRSSTGPAEQAFNNLAFDIARGELVLSGPNETWIWDGGTWSIRRSPQVPPPRLSPLSIYDERRGRVVAVGGQLFGGPSGAWEWDGSNWLTGPLGPAVGAGSAMVYDAHRGQGLWLGGREPSYVGGRSVRDSQMWLYGDLDTAMATPFGTPCGGGTAPALQTFGTPHVGNVGFALDITRAPAGSPAALLFDLTPVAIPIGGGCTLSVAPTASVASATNAFGIGTVALPIPNDPSLVGDWVLTQAAVAAPGTAIGLGLTAGLRLDLGY
ncbi:MAG: hypothetical protein AAF628_28260 [Planctomycetota bacterium]